jgi:flavodoxin
MVAARGVEKLDRIAPDRRIGRLGRLVGCPAASGEFESAGRVLFSHRQYARDREPDSAFGADLFEIQPAASYPEDYEATVKQAEQERVAGYEPPLKDTIPNIAAYDTVFLGFPIWGMTAPAVVRSFLSKHDMSEKTLAPLITHGGYGLGKSLDVVTAHAPRARLLKAFSMRADQERETLSQVTGWLRQTSIAN